MTTIPARSDVWLTRIQLSTALSEHGYPVAVTTLATKATRGGGPPFKKFGPKALYRLDLALEWARSQLKEPPRRRASADSAVRVTA
jgi:hypothetical protein